jgi:hypothetical protein
MKATKLIFTFLVGLGIFVLSCEKEEVPAVGNCSDGFMNNGELGADCGGPCPPCQGSNTSVFYAAFNAEMVFFNNPTAVYGDTIFLGASNDSIQVSLRFKNLNEPDESGQLWPFLVDGQAFVTYNGFEYTQIDTLYSNVIVTENLNNRLSGLFQLRLPHGVNNLDTMKVFNGTFVKISY